MEGPARQLQQDLSDSIVRKLSIQRPVVTHLNADTSWVVPDNLPCKIKMILDPDIMSDGSYSHSTNSEIYLGGCLAYHGKVRRTDVFGSTS